MSLYSIYDVEELRNISWTLIFHHNVSGGFFKTHKEALFSFKPDKYSILGYIDDSFKINDKFEFVLIYPENPGYNHWTQKINPIHAQPNENNGYEEINCSWKSNSWKGLSISSYSPSTFLDGSPFVSSCFYAIGQIHNEPKYPNSLAGPEWTFNRGGQTYHRVDLYMRVDDVTLLHKIHQLSTIKQINNQCYRPSLYSHILIVISFK